MMKRFFFPLILLLIPSGIFAQAPFSYARRIQPYAALPASCNPLNGDVVMLTAGAGISPGIYNCVATNTWRPAGFQGNQFNIAQGTLTALLPGLNITATWNNAAVTFVGIKEDITNTASAAGSRLFQLNVGGGEKFAVDVAGNYLAAGSASVAAAQAYYWTGRSRLESSADGVVNLQNSTDTAFTRLTFGPVAVTQPAITVSAAVGGQAQGVIFTKADGTNNVFADLGAATNGSITYCSNCTVANPCAGGGTGAIAKRLNGVWVCN